MVQQGLPWHHHVFLIFALVCRALCSPCLAPHIGLWIRALCIEPITYGVEALRALLYREGSTLTLPSHIATLLLF